jgi:polyferredoxin
MKKEQIKEPIRKKWIWIVLFLIILGIVPWYFPKSAGEIFILGFPLWAFISTFFTLVLCGYLSWLCLHQWYIVEDSEKSPNGKESEG